MVSDRDEALTFERAQQPAQIAGIEPETVAQFLQVRAPGAGLENEPRLGERPAAAQVAVRQRADALRHEAVEPANLLDLSIHSLTLVREISSRQAKFATRTKTVWEVGA